MKRRYLSFLLLSLLAVSTGGCSDSSSSNTIATNIKFRPDGVLEFRQTTGELVTRIVIEIAVSDSAQARGLMDRRSLPEKGGMIFINKKPSDRAFWMRNTPIPLDIIFIRADSTIANIARHTTPYSDARVEYDGEAQFVVEVRAGFTKRMNIHSGQRVSWRREIFDPPT